MDNQNNNRDEDYRINPDAQSRVQRYDVPNEGQPEPEQNNYQPRQQKQPKRHHFMRWFFGILVIIIAFFGFSTYHEYQQLSNLQRHQDTLLDQVIKGQAKQIAKDHADAENKPKIIKIIETEPLSKLQQAANNEQLMTQIAEQNQINQAQLQQFETKWFNQQNQDLRNAIQTGNLLKAYPELQYYVQNKLQGH